MTYQLPRFTNYSTSKVSTQIIYGDSNSTTAGVPIIYLDKDSIEDRLFYEAVASRTFKAYVARERKLRRENPSKMLHSKDLSLEK